MKIVITGANGYIGSNLAKLCLDSGHDVVAVDINNEYIGCAWAVPYILNCKDAFHKGNNTIRIEVTNLPANRIADLDRRGVKWRKMNEINIVNINYKRTTYDSWSPVPSGLGSSVRLIETM